MRKYFILFFLLNVINSFGVNYNISNKGKQNIIKYESCSLTAYWDSNGYSIGYGHHGKDVKKGMKITKAKATWYFNQDINKVNASVNRIIKSLPVQHKFTQNFIDGLYDLVYNCGEQGVMNSTFYKRLKACRKNNKNDMNFTIAAVKTCCVSAKGHINRRINTMKLMLG